MTRSRLLLAAHGTESEAGTRTLTAFRAAVAAARPGLDVGLCFLDVARPSLADALVGSPGPTVVVPLLLSTGYHVETDIPAVVAGRAVVTPHLGPDPLVVEAVADRLGDVAAASTVALVGVGSSRASARAEHESAASQLAAVLDRPVVPLTLGADVTPALAALPGPVAVAAYLLAEGRFSERLTAAAAGVATVSPPLGAHPALVRLVLDRYDAAPR
jgi:sirohydrochlorin ferrochelatase